MQCPVQQVICFKLTAAHGNVRLDDPENPTVEALASALNNSSSHVRHTVEQGSPIAELELVNLLANLNITPGKPADMAAIPELGIRSNREGNTI